MATTDLLHKNLTDPQLHEPIGISTAEENTVYIANGKGSGEWKPMEFSYLEINPVPVEKVELSSKSEVAAINDTALTAGFTGSMVAVSEANIAHNLKQLSTQFKQLKASLEIAHANIEKLYGAHEKIREALTTLGVLNG